MMLLSLAFAIVAQLTPQMRDGIAGAHDIPAYSGEQRTQVVGKLLHLTKQPNLRTTSLTPNAPFAGNGAHLSFWKNSFVIGTPAGSALVRGQALGARLTELGEEGFLIERSTLAGEHCTVVAANTDIGVLYGVFACLRLLQTHCDVSALSVRSAPKLKLL